MKGRETAGDQGTPLCDSLLDGRYPSHVRELKESDYPLDMLELGLARHRPMWPPLGPAAMAELPAGISVHVGFGAEPSPPATSLRILGVPGGFTSANLLRGLADIADRCGEGHLRWTAGGCIEMPMPQPRLLEAVRELNALGMDVGSTGDDVRCIVACPGSYRCNLALINALALADALGRAVIDDQQYPGLPNKVKTGISGCPHDCVRAQTQKDHAFIGVYRGVPQIDDERLVEWDERQRAQRRAGIAAITLEELIVQCPTRAMEKRGESIAIDPVQCIHCMHCSSSSPAIAPGPRRGVAWVVGGKYGNRGRNGPMIGFVLAPFIPVRPPEFVEVVDLYQRFLDLFLDQGRRRERIGDMLVRLGPQRIQELMGIEVTATIPGRLVLGH